MRLANDFGEFVGVAPAGKIDLAGIKEVVYGFDAGGVKGLVCARGESDPLRR